MTPTIGHIDHGAALITEIISTCASDTAIVIVSSCERDTLTHSPYDECDTLLCIEPEFHAYAIPEPVQEHSDCEPEYKDYDPPPKKLSYKSKITPRVSFNRRILDSRSGMKGKTILRRIGK